MEANDVIVLLNAVFFGLVICGIVAIGYLFDVLVNFVNKRRVAPEKRKRTIVLVCFFAMYLVLFGGLSVHWLIRCYSLPEVVNAGTHISFEGQRFERVSRNTFANPSSLDLVLAGRDVLIRGATPGVWAFDVITSPNYYVQRGDAERMFIFYDDVGEWIIFKRVVSD
jgi:hypothetical protein